jgi:2-polyprenyl-3-methyl-5-hydroxy-6-metoxy-1,4-benzoquinol methylase
MFNWREYTEDPNNAQVAQKFRSHLLSIREFKIIDSDDYLLDECKGKAVLDIGPCEHTEDYINHKNWFFRKVTKVAERVVGVDINQKLCKYAQELGFDMRHIDACSEEFLGEKFNLILAGDVIEHVSNIGGLLRFIKRHLAIDGKVIITTPNPFSYRHFFNVLKKGTSAPNLEHTCWITPTCMHELAMREGLNLKQITFPIKPSSGRKLVVNIFPKGRKFMEVLSGEYLFELTHLN